MMTNGDHERQIFLSHPNVNNGRVATVREKVLENEKCSRSGKSRNVIFNHGNLEKMKKVMEKSGNFKNLKKMLVNWLLVFNKLQAILEKECFLT